MAHLTSHSESRLAVVCRELGVQPNIVAALRRHLEQATPDGDAAVCCAATQKACLSDREQWAESDVVAAIVRNSKVVTVMATRKGQVTPDHLRVKRIEWLS
jgi:hypothetical protein